MSVQKKKVQNKGSPPKAGDDMYIDFQTIKIIKNEIEIVRSFSIGPHIKGKNKLKKLGGRKGKKGKREEGKNEKKKIRDLNNGSKKRTDKLRRKRRQTIRMRKHSVGLWDKRLKERLGQGRFGDIKKGEKKEGEGKGGRKGRKRRKKNQNLTAIVIKNKGRATKKRGRIIGKRRKVRGKQSN